MPTSTSVLGYQGLALPLFPEGRSLSHLRGVALPDVPQWQCLSTCWRLASACRCAHLPVGRPWSSLGPLFSGSL